MLKHIRGETEPESGMGREVLEASLPSSFGTAPGTFQLYSDSLLWKVVDLQIRRDPERKVSSTYYSLWCYNTRPDQRPLIEEIARHIQAPVTILNPHPDPWNDPRFWIVLDWLIAWGEPSDFERLEQLIPSGPAHDEYRARSKGLLSNPAFFNCEVYRPLDDRATGELAGSTEGAQVGLNVPDLVDFSDVKVKHQPATLSYPPEARMRGLMGATHVLVTVDPAGIVCKTRPAPGPWLAFLAPASLNFAKDWQFEPMKVQGIPRQGKFILNVVFRLRK